MSGVSYASYSRCYRLIVTRKLKKETVGVSGAEKKFGNGYTKTNTWWLNS